MMKRIAVLLLVGCTFSLQTLAQAGADDPTFAPTVKVGKVLDKGDSIQYMELSNVYVYPQLEFKNKRQQASYMRLVKNVKAVLPLAKDARYLLVETAEFLETLPTKKAKEEHMKRVEASIFKEYKPKMKKLTIRRANFSSSSSTASATLRATRPFRLSWVLSVQASGRCLPGLLVQV